MNSQPAGKRITRYSSYLTPHGSIINSKAQIILMADFSTFFKESDSSLGVFYPKHYIIATFHHYSAAKGAFQELRDAGFAEDEAMLATGVEVLEFFKHFSEDAGLWGIVMRPLSRFIGTEAANADLNVEQAKEGAGFIAIHSPTEEDAFRIMAMMKGYSPSSADWYLWGGIRSML